MCLSSQQHRRLSKRQRRQLRIRQLRKARQTRLHLQRHYANSSTRRVLSWKPSPRSFAAQPFSALPSCWSPPS